MQQEQLPRGRGRPPKERGNNLQTREMLIRVGTEVVTEKGFSSIGIDGLLQQTGISRCCFYYYFKTKEGFGAELIERYRRHVLDNLEQNLANETLSPLCRLRAFVDEVRGEMLRKNWHSGCLIGKLAQEVNTLPASFRGLLSRAFSDWQELFTKGLLLAQSAGELSADHDCRKTAAFFWYGWEGALQRANLELSAAPVDIFIDQFFERLGQHPG